MSVLTNKQILLVGGESPQVVQVEDNLRSHGSEIIKLACTDVTPEKIVDLGVDIVLINHLDDEDTCNELLTVLSRSETSKKIPAFVVVPNSDDSIQQALAMGATDYVTPEEEPDSIVRKIKSLFNEGGDVYGGTAIDITPEQADISTTGIKVYVVEDDPLLRNLLSIQLSKSSFPAEFNNDGNNSVPAMKQFKPDIVVLDLMLPGKTGFEVLEEIKAEDELRNIPVIVFSNRDSAEDRDNAKKLGAVGFYVKAMTDLSELMETIQSIVRK